MLTDARPSSDGSNHKADCTLSLLDATALLCTWSTSSSNVMYPFVFGVLGVGGGPALMFAAFAVNWQCTRWTVRAARLTGARTLGDLGDHLWGAKGRWCLEGSQMLFQQLFLPVALVFSAQSLQSLLGWGCNGNAILCFVGLGFFLTTTLSQSLGHSVGLAYGSIALIVVQTACIVWAVTATPPPPGLDHDDDNEDKGYSSRWEWLVGAGNGDGQHEERYQWHNVAAALGVFIYSCLPNCIAVETMASLKPGVDRARMEQAVDVSFAFYVFIYLLTGLPAVIGGWGGDIPIPISGVMRNDFAGVLTKLILIYSTMLDFVLASVTVNRFLVARYFNPAFFKGGAKPPALDAAAAPTSWLSRCAAAAPARDQHRVQWMYYSLPSLVLATLMALLIPRLESLTGLLNSITGTTVQVTAVVLCLFMAPGGHIVSGGDAEGEGGGQQSDSQAVAATAAAAAVTSAGSMCSLRQRYAAIGVYGVGLTVLIFSEAVYSIVYLTDYSAEDFWCEVVGR
jgi:hypothetical protein